jgi:hypothetical protein
MACHSLHRTNCLVNKNIGRSPVHGEPGSAHRYAPDGLAGAALDELINRTYAEVAKASRPRWAL